jgi:hypothetical protein
VLGALIEKLAHDPAFIVNIVDYYISKYVPTEDIGAIIQVLMNRARDIKNF